MRLGPNFYFELESAGLVGLPFSWNLETGEFTGRDELTEEQLIALDAVISMHDPDRPPPYPADPVERLREFLTANPDILPHLVNVDG